MPSVNKIELMDNLGQDPEIRYFPDGTPAAKISLAVGETWTDKNTGQKQERTEWFTVLFRNKLAETVGRLLKKGDTLLVWGKNPVAPIHRQNGCRADGVGSPRP